MSVVVEVVDVAGRRLELVRPADPETLLSEEAFEREEFLPYWAELWPSALELTRALAARDLGGLRVVELGCGLAVPSIVAALGGAQVLAADWSAEALEFARENAARNGVELELLQCSWSDPGQLVARAPFDLAIASDVLYERRDVAPLVDLLPQLAPEVLLADPGRPAAAAFLAAFDATEIAPRVYRLRGRAGGRV
jgi:predicted nicotinamide N-methyase